MLILQWITIGWSFPAIFWYEIISLRSSPAPQFITNQLINACFFLHQMWPMHVSFLHHKSRKWYLEKPQDLLSSSAHAWFRYSFIQLKLGSATLERIPHDHYPLTTQPRDVVIQVNFLLETQDLSKLNTTNTANINIYWW